MSQRSSPNSYPIHHRCKSDLEKKIKFDPWEIEKCFTQEIKSQPVIIRSNKKSEFVIEISNEKKVKFFPTIKSNMFSTLQRKGRI